MTEKGEANNKKSGNSDPKEIPQTPSSTALQNSTKSVDVKATALAERQVLTETTTAPVVMHKEPTYSQSQQPWLPTWVPALLSVVAICLTIANFVYSLRKDRRARKQSIQDDYWFRKIASPITIEPLVKNLLGISVGLPDPTSITTETAKSLWKEQAAQVEEFRTTVGALALLSKDLPRNLVKYIDTMSDELSEFYGQCMLDIESGSSISNREKTKGALVDAMIQMLEMIQKDQEKVGYSEWKFKPTMG